ncbi:WD repeat domain 81 isoform X2 [Leptinotarsa decemlineata]|uniref:WD repeat domain 81 isoform X2 n=1 Tax=Leptinotarsa decemlineata TaxID=7539 RepID=UPI003D3045B1
MTEIFKELGIPESYLQSTSREDRFIASVHKLWLKSLIKYLKLSVFIKKSSQEKWPEENIDSSWVKIFISVMKKKDCDVLPLPRVQTPKEEKTLFSQFMESVFQRNFINIWRESYRKYAASKSERDTKVNLVAYNSALKEVIIRIYGCSIINAYDPELTINNSMQYERQLNIFPAACAVETRNAIFLLHFPYMKHNLSDCVTFSSAILEKSHGKSLFLIYQLLNILKSLHERSLTLGEVQLKDIYISEDMWIYVFPQIDFNFVETCNLTKNLETGVNDSSKPNTDSESDNCGVQTYDKVQVADENLEQLCMLWIEGQISNFTYIMFLNKFSGRVWGDPNCHYVFPWVTDFTSRCGKNWRDLKKSKYRLNKGDHQLDLTYNNCQSQVAHHVSDVLSPITYYVYMARQTSMSVLCKNVRTVWVPAEYPSSIQRIQEWTPDECIPEFYSDASIFRSIHDDLADLAVPSWCSGPEDFIKTHREALESVYVSETIHNWIDLTFGYKLSGSASIKARNVCLNLVDDHEYLTKSGLVQLFSQPHPSRAMDSSYWAKSPPKIFITKSVKQKIMDRSNSSSIQDVIQDENLHYTHISSGLSKLSPISQAPLHGEVITRSHSNNTSQNNECSKSVVSESSNFFTYSNTGLVNLPNEYKPELALETLERNYNFFSKTFPYITSKTTEGVCLNNEVQENLSDDITQHSFLEYRTSRNEKFHIVSSCQHSSHNKTVSNGFGKATLHNFAEIITLKRIREMKVLGCLIIEIFMAKQLRVLGANIFNFNLDKRVENCLAVIESFTLPPCISHIVNLLLQPNILNSKKYIYPVITDIGLPPPRANLLLDPLLHCVIPFSKHFSLLYKILNNLKNFKNVSMELNIFYYYDCNGQMCSEYEPLEKSKICISQSLAECEIKSSIKNLENLFNEINSKTDVEVISILVPHIIDLMEDSSTSVLAAWYLFEPLSSVLGPNKSSQYFLGPLLKLYENDPNAVYFQNGVKIAKIYHHSFLLSLMVRLGLKCFLENFIVPLVEAVGGYKDCELVEFLLHNHSEKKIIKAFDLKRVDSEQMDILDSDDSTSSDKQEILSGRLQESSSNEEIFEFEDEKIIDQEKFSPEHLQSNVASKFSFNNFNIEEDLGDFKNLEKANSQSGEFFVSRSHLKPPKSPRYCSNMFLRSQSDDTINVDFSNSESEKDVENPGNKVSEMSADSVIWLSHRLGPLLTAKYLSKNLLKILALCYMGEDNLASRIPADLTKFENSIASSYVVGDIAAVKIVSCLTSISGLYGEHFILSQYIPHMADIIHLCKKRITPNLEGALISCLSLLKQVIPFYSDRTLMDQLQGVLSKNIIYPVVYILGSTKHTFPCGSCARNILARKYLDTIYSISMRIGIDMTMKYLMIPAVQSFFSIFDTIDIISLESLDEVSFVQQTPSSSKQCVSQKISFVSPSCVPLQRSNVAFKERGPANCGQLHDKETVLSTILQELREVFTPELAYTAYLPFIKLLGYTSLEVSLKNHDKIRSLCQKYEESIGLSIHKSMPELRLSDLTEDVVEKSNSIGSNVSLTGNRIDVQNELVDTSNIELLELLSNQMDNNVRHLRGNWLEYWENEIGRLDSNNSLNFKQIKLQTFVGHSQSVKCLHKLDNENSFISGSRDKTIKLWSLRNQGDGFCTSNCQWTYNSHKKSILSMTFIESIRLVASCDSVVHIWDPFMGSNLGNLDSSKFSSVNTLKSMPAPSAIIFAATSDGTLKILDTRMLQYVQELKMWIF